MVISATLHIQRTKNTNINKKTDTAYLLNKYIVVQERPILGPILFILFINDIYYFLNYLITIFADDTSVTISGKKIVTY